MADRVLISEALNAELDALGPALEVDLQPKLWADRGRLLDSVRGCVGLVVRNQTAVDVELIASAPGLRVVGRLGAGLDNLDLAALESAGVTVVHGGGLNARAVAEYVLGAALDLARGLARADREVRAGGWTRRPGFELRGRTLGVIGLGATGRATAELGRAVGMEVRGFDPAPSGPVSGVEQVPLDHLLERSAVVTVHVPLTESTRNLLGDAELRRLPRGALLINASRGGVVDEAALAASLMAGHLRGAALDVRTIEPPGARDRLLGRDDVLLTPHIAGMTQESQAAIAASVLGDVRRVLAGRRPTGPAIVPGPRFPR